VGQTDVYGQADVAAHGRVQVLARSSPEDKLQLVRLLKELGEVVAVSGGWVCVRLCLTRTVSARRSGGRV
jgi:hypothetical protein